MTAQYTLSDASLTRIEVVRAMQCLKKVEDENETGEVLISMLEKHMKGVRM